MLTDIQAYIAMFQFLVDLWQTYRDRFDNEFPSLLGSMELLRDGLPPDQAMWFIWKKLVAQDPLDEEQAFISMVDFLSEIHRSYKREKTEILIVIEMLETSREESLKKWSHIAREVAKSDISTLLARSTHPMNKTLRKSH